MTEPLMVAFVSGGFLLVATLITAIVPALIKQGRLIQGIQEDASASREQVQNNHRTNLRDDLDKALRGIDQLLVGQGRHAEDIGLLQLDITWLKGEQRNLAHEQRDLAQRVDAID